MWPFLKYKYFIYLRYPEIIGSKAGIISNVNDAVAKGKAAGQPTSD